MSGRDEHTDAGARRPAPAADQGVPVSAVLYARHALNNPILYVDPSGHVPCIDGNCGSGVYDSFLQDFSYYNSRSSPCLEGMCYPESSGQPGGIDEDVGIGDGDGLDVDNIVFAIFEALLGNPDESVDFLNTTSDWIVKFVFPIGFDNFDANGQLINYVVVNQTSFRKAGAWIDGLPKCWANAIGWGISAAPSQIENIVNNEQASGYIADGIVDVFGIASGELISIGRGLIAGVVTGSATGPAPTYPNPAGWTIIRTSKYLGVSVW